MDYLSKDQLGSLLAVLIAQLRRDGILSADSIDNMQRRLIDGGDDEVALAITGVVLSDQLDSPAVRRGTLHLVQSSDGGKDD